MSHNTDEADLISNIGYSENDFVSEIVDKVFFRLIAEQKLPQVFSTLKPGGLSHVPSKPSKTDVTHISGSAASACSYFGPIPGIPVGSWWPHLDEVRVVHGTPRTFIYGSVNTGAYSILLNSWDSSKSHDNGDQISICVGGSMKLRNLNENTLHGLTKALAMNCNADLNGVSGNFSTDWKRGKPLRVIRSFRLIKRSIYAPTDGYRYDGIYKVVRYNRLRLNARYHTWFFELRRDDESLAPWNFAKMTTALDHDYIDNDYLKNKIQSERKENIENKCKVPIECEEKPFTEISKPKEEDNLKPVSSYNLTEKNVQWKQEDKFPILYKILNECIENKSFIKEIKENGNFEPLCSAGSIYPKRTCLMKTQKHDGLDSKTNCALPEESITKINDSLRPIVLLQKLPIDQKYKITDYLKTEKITSPEKQTLKHNMLDVMKVHERLNETKKVFSTTKPTIKRRSIINSQRGRNIHRKLYQIRISSSSSTHFTADHNYTFVNECLSSQAVLPSQKPALAVRHSRTISSLHKSTCKNSFSSLNAKTRSKKLHFVSSLKKSHNFALTYNSQDNTILQSNLCSPTLDKSFSVENTPILNQILSSIEKVSNFKIKQSLPTSEQSIKTNVAEKLIESDKSASTSDLLCDNAIKSKLVTNLQGTKSSSNENRYPVSSTSFDSGQRSASEKTYPANIFECEDVKPKVPVISQKFSSYNSDNEECQSLVPISKNNSNLPILLSESKRKYITNLIKKDRLNENTWEYIQCYSNSESVFLKNITDAFTCPSCSNLATVTMLCQHNACSECLVKRYLKKLKTCPYFQCEENIQSVIYLNSKADISVHENVILKNILRILFPNRL